jgi:cytochrome c
VKVRLVVVTLVVIGLFINIAWAAGDVAAGQKAFTEKCANCHGAKGEGKDAIAKVMKIEFKPLGSKDVQAMTDADLKKTIADGMGKMKPVTGVNAKMADDIVSFVRTLKQ